VLIEKINLAVNVLFLISYDYYELKEINNTSILVIWVFWNWTGYACCKLFIKSIYLFIFEQHI